MKIKIILISGFLLLIFNTNGKAATRLDPYGFPSSPLRKENTHHFSLSRQELWEKDVTEAAKTWNQTLDQIKKEAEEFLYQHRKRNPGSSFPNSIIDLIVLKKPSIPDELKSRIEIYNKNHPDQPVSLEKFINVSQKKFLIERR